MKKKIAVATFAILLASCASVHSPKPAPIDGLLPPKVQTLQLNQSVRAILGARDKDDLLIRVGADGTLTLLGAPGQGFKVETRKGGEPPGKGVVNQFTVTTTKNSPLCNKIEGAGWVIYFASPPCPVQ